MVRLGLVVALIAIALLAAWPTASEPREFGEEIHPRGQRVLKAKRRLDPKKRYTDEE